MRLLLLAGLAILSGLGWADRAAAATLSVREVAVHLDGSARGARSTSSVAPAAPFDYLGLHWKGNGLVSYRVRSPSGIWSDWTSAEQDFGPDDSSRELRETKGWRLGEGIWVGRSTRVDVRTQGHVSRVRAYMVNSPASRVPTRSVTSADEPPVVTRAGWQADESLRREEPQTASELRYAVVHHTAGTNDYRQRDVPAILRAIQLYHVKGNGWNDIGYNALVDRFGVVYEGRYGGLERNIVGAHAKGFNTGSFGIAVLGEFTKTTPSAAAREATAQMLAWRLDLAHVDPLATVAVVSGGSERFLPGVPVFIRAISGHRDTGLTACPGQKLYDELSSIAARVSAIGLPKLYEPELTGSLGGPVTVTARLSSALPWTFTVSGGSGEVVFESSGEGDSVNLTWDASGLTLGTYRWRLEAPGITPAEGSIGSGSGAPPASLSLTAVAADPTTFAPDGDGTLDSTTLSYTLSVPASVGIGVFDPTGVELAIVERPRWRAAGTHALEFDGLGLPDGVYDVRLSAKATGGRTATSSTPLSISRTLGGVSLASPRLSPNADGRDETLSVRFTLGGPATVRLKVLRGSLWTATPFVGELGSGPQSVEWDGTKRVGRLREGSYVAVLEATDAIATARVVMPFVADWTPPRVAVVSLDPLVIRMSEPGTLRIRADGVDRRVRVGRAGLVRVSSVRKPRALVIGATDLAGNTASPLRRPSP